MGGGDGDSNNKGNDLLETISSQALQANLFTPAIFDYSVLLRSISAHGQMILGATLIKAKKAKQNKIKQNFIHNEKKNYEIGQIF